MRYIFGLFVAICLIFATTTIGETQETPVEIDTVLATLSSALNTTITPDMLDDVSWSQVTFSSTALGCPRPQQAYEQVILDGYQVFVVYQGVTYDYRVTTGSDYVVLCSTADTNVVTPPAPVVVETVVVDPNSADNACSDDLPPRLALGELARTTPELGSNVRDLPELDATDLGTIPPSETFTIIGGTECDAEGNYWWQVDYNGLVGWVVNGLGGLYFVEPIPAPLPAVTTTISYTTALEVTLLSEIEGNLLGTVAWSADGQMIAIADASTANPAIWLYFVGNLSQVPALVEVTFDTTALAFSPDGTLLAIGDPQGNVHLMEMETFTITTSFQAHDTAVLDIDFSPTGEYMVVMDDNYTARFYGVVTP